MTIEHLYGVLLLTLIAADIRHWMAISNLKTYIALNYPTNGSLKEALTSLGSDIRDLKTEIRGFREELSDLQIEHARTSGNHRKPHT